MLPQRLWRSWGPNTGQKESLVELVKQEHGLRVEPPQRGCGCLSPVAVLLAIALAVILAVAAVQCEYSPDGSSETGNDGDTAIAKTRAALPAQEQGRRLDVMVE